MGKRILFMRIDELSGSGVNESKATVTFRDVAKEIGDTFIPYQGTGTRTPELAAIEEAARDKMKIAAQTALRDLHLGSYFISVMSKKEFQDYLTYQIRLEQNKELEEVDGNRL